MTVICVHSTAPLLVTAAMSPVAVWNNGVGWTSWSDWSSCSVTCGIGQRQKSRSCQNPSASIINNKCPGNVEEIQI
ncbi:ATS14-like protein [Mya arenaria]|uniref:ATS14-like protein n=1 Tax=Mya arenaria TaxID=6604 RepID=A0ABY7EGB8_MYAAR|nr:ATS14-like protein [Mya arenaria]